MDFEKLPCEFTHLLIDKKVDFLEFRIKEVNDEFSAKFWITRMSEESKTTWRVERTYPETKGKYNVFKLDMRCQHRTDSRAKGISHSKNTNCPASFRILVKRYIQKSRSKCPDLLTKDWPTVCTFKKNHNHPIESAAVLKCRDLSEASKEILRLLFRKGHNPSSALQCLKTYLLHEHGDEYYKIDTDGYYVPSLSVVSKLFKKEFSDIYGGMTGPGMPLNQLSAVDTIMFTETNVRETKENLQSSENINTKETNIASISDTLTTTSENETSSADDLIEFDALIARMKEGYQNEPDLFVPAMKKMLKNAQTTATTQNGLLSAMHTFGLYSDTAGKTNRDRHQGQHIGVQPTSINRRKSLFPSKRKLSAGCPAQSAKVPKELKSHDYISLADPTDVVLSPTDIVLPGTDSRK